MQCLFCTSALQHDYKLEMDNLNILLLKVVVFQLSWYMIVHHVTMYIMYMMQVMVMIDKRTTQHMN